MPRNVIFKGRRVELVIDTVELPGGKTVEREIVLHPGAAVVVPVVRPGTIVLLRQYRPAVGADLYELPAGTLEPDEPPEACAARELTEETGYRASSLRKLASFWTSPGILRERMHLFLASGLTRASARPDEGEMIEGIIEVSLEEARAMVRDGRVEDAKTIVGILFVSQFETV
jgi:ADP-ribose pyrophosphatase